MSVILPCLPIFLNSFSYIFAVFFLGFIALLIKGLTTL